MRACPAAVRPLDQGSEQPAVIAPWAKQAPPLRSLCIPLAALPRAALVGLLGYQLLLLGHFALLAPALVAAVPEVGVPVP